MRSARPPRSPMCDRADHARCSHWSGLRIVRSRPIVVCGCGCHERCLLTGQRRVSLDVWRQECSCPGAVPAREAADRRRDLAAVVREVPFDDHPDAPEVEARLRSALRAAGQQPPPGLTGWSQVVAASTARRGTRSARLVGLVVSVLRRPRRAETPEDAANRAEARRMWRVVAGASAFAALATVRAVRVPRRSRLPWVLAAIAGWLLAAWTGAFGLGVALLTRSLEGGPPPAG